MKKIVVLTVLFLLFPLWLFSESKGPLLGTNYYLPYVPYYSFPGFSASPGEQGNLNISLANYFIQDMVTEFHISGTTVFKERFIDYEGYVFEPTISFNVRDRIELGATGRIQAYYGGFWDSVIEGFHDLFGFANGGREYYDQNEVYVNIHTDNGIDLSLTESSLALGDTDLFVKWSFYSHKKVDLALFSAIKIPTGSIESLSGSGYPDLGVEILMDFYLLDWLTLYFQNGVIFPGQFFLDHSDSPQVMYSMQTALEFIISPVVSLVTQFRLNTSPIEEGSVMTEILSYSVNLHKPMTNILAGFIVSAGEYRLQFDFEEDSFTNSGADLILNFTVSRSFSTGK
jgi:hypothetical protein